MKEISAQTITYSLSICMVQKKREYFWLEQNTEFYKDVLLGLSSSSSSSLFRFEHIHSSSSPSMCEVLVSNKQTKTSGKLTQEINVKTQTKISIVLSLLKHKLI